MKSFLLVMMFCTFLMAETTNNTDKATTLTKSKEFTATLSPDKLTTKLSISVIKDDYTKAANTISSLSTVLHQYENICKSSGYSIDKVGEWDNVKRKNIFIGYRGFFNLECEYFMPSDIEELYNNPSFKKNYP